MKHDPMAPPCAERLAEYYEGSLDSAQRQQVETWLADHPEVASDFIALQQMQRLFQAAAPAEPSESAWAAARDRIEQGLIHPGAGVKSFRSGWWAAAVVAGVGILWMVQGRPTPVALPEVVEAFPVASTEDVEITSVDAAGSRALLVGAAPVQAPIVLMVAGDARLKSVAIEPDGQFPEVRMAPGEQAPPMIVGPVVAGTLLYAP